MESRAADIVFLVVLFLVGCDGYGPESSSAKKNTSTEHVTVQIASGDSLKVGARALTEEDAIQCPSSTYADREEVKRVRRAVPNEKRLEIGIWKKTADTAVVATPADTVRTTMIWTAVIAPDGTIERRCGIPALPGS